jgi:hypothetical protein
VTPANAITLNARTRQVAWNLTNATGNPLTISKITVGAWPQADGLLTQVRLAEMKISDANVPWPGPAVITSFLGGVARRTIGTGEAKQLELDFRNVPVAGTYEITVQFTNGCSAHFP